MTRRFLIAVVFSACAASVLATPVEATRDKDADRASRVFTSRVHAYLQGNAASRADARQGDLFTSEVTKEFKKIIRTAFKGKDGRNMRRTIRESDPVRPTILHVNDIYPEDIPLTTMPPMLLRTLPALPAELAYRIIGNALVLQELKTNMIVDFMPDAIPAPK